MKLAIFFITGVMKDSYSFRQNMEPFWAHSSL